MPCNTDLYFDVYMSSNVECDMEIYICQKLKWQLTYSMWLILSLSIILIVTTRTTAAITTSTTTAFDLCDIVLIIFDTVSAYFSRVTPGPPNVFQKLLVWVLMQFWYPSYHPMPLLKCILYAHLTYNIRHPSESSNTFLSHSPSTLTIFSCSP